MRTAAFEDGLRRFDWWPNWDGDCVAIIASGPSVKGMNLEVLRDRVHVVVVKTCVDLCPWADVCYGCDAPWWVDRKGLPSFKGIKLFHGLPANQWPGMHRVEIDIKTDTMLVEKALKIGNGGNSGFQALNLTLQFGAKDIMLIGFDMSAPRGELHWYGRNKAPGMNNPAPVNFTRWIKGFELARKSIESMGVDVVNCSPDSAMSTFRKSTLDQTMKEWGL